MTFLDQVAISLHNYFAIGLLFFVLLILRRMYRQDRFRQNMFALRDELFDFASSGEIKFDHPAYTILRTSMNGMIRFAHRVTLTHVLVSYVLMNRIGTKALSEDHQKNLEDSFNQVHNLETRLRVREFHDRMRYLLAEHLVKSSLIIFGALSIVIVFAVVRGASKTLWERVWNSVPGFDLLEAEAEDVGAS